MRPTKLVDFEDITKHHKMNIMLYEPKKDMGKDAGCIWQDSAQKLLAHNKNEIIRGSLFLHKHMDVYGCAV